MDAPVYGCHGCAGTGGRMSCPDHGLVPRQAPSIVLTHEKELADLQASRLRLARALLTEVTNNVERDAWHAAKIEASRIVREEERKS